VAVSVMQVRVMQMAAPQRLMPVPVRMQLRHRPVMTLPVVQVMDMAVLMLERVVFVIVTTDPFHTGSLRQSRCNQ
jgi:hypothetical protein